MGYTDYYYHFFEEDTEPQSSTITDTTEKTTDTISNKVNPQTDKKEEPQSVENKEHKSTEHSTDRTQHLYPSQIQSIVKSEVKKLMDIERRKQSVSHSPQSQKNQPQKRTKTPKGKTNQQNHKRGSNSGFPLSYEKLQPINISPNSVDRFIPFNSKEVNDLLREHLMDLSIVSVCIGNRTPTVSMNLSLYLQFFLIKSNLPYIPIYTVRGGVILDIQFIVFGTEYLSNLQIPKLISSYILLQHTNQQWKFIYCDYKKSIVMGTLYYQSVINYYTKSRGITVDNHCSLFVNPPPLSGKERYLRTTKRLEVSFTPKKV